VSLILVWIVKAELPIIGVRRYSIYSQTLACPLSLFRFKTLTDTNSHYYLLFHSGTRWLSFCLDSMASTMTLLVALFVVLNNDIISPSLKGLALSYTIQVILEQKTNEPLEYFCCCKDILKATAMCVLKMCFPVDRHASVYSEASNRRGG